MVTENDFGNALITPYSPVPYIRNDYKNPSIILDKERLVMLERSETSPLNEEIYSVRLESPPETNIILDIGNHDADIFSVSPNILYFTSDNYAHRQTVSVYSLPDGDTEDKQTQITHTIRNNSAYNAPVAIMPVYIVDSDVEVTDNASIPGIVLDEDKNLGTYVKFGDDEDSVSYSIRLRSRPISDVTVYVTTENTSVRLSRDTLTFTPRNWYLNQEILVYLSSNLYYTELILSHFALNYGGVNRDISLLFNTEHRVVAGNVIYDNRTPHIIVDNSETTGSFRVRLTKPPVGDVILRALAIDSNTLEVSPSTLLFSRTNWNLNQRVRYNILLPTSTYTGTGYSVEYGDYELSENSILINRPVEAAKGTREESIASRTLKNKEDMDTFAESIQNSVRQIS